MRRRDFAGSPETDAARLTVGASGTGMHDTTPVEGAAEARSRAVPFAPGERCVRGVSSACEGLVEFSGFFSGAAGISSDREGNRTGTAAR